MGQTRRDRAKRLLEEPAHLLVQTGQHHPFQRIPTRKRALLLGIGQAERLRPKDFGVFEEIIDDEQGGRHRKPG